MTMDSTITKPCYQCGKMTHTDKTLADQCRLMTAIASTTMDSAATKLCYQCGEVTHTDKMLADQCRLMTAILGEGWGRLSSKPMDISKVERYSLTKGTEPTTNRRQSRELHQLCRLPRSPWPSMMMTGMTVLMRIPVIRRRGLLPRLRQHIL